MVGRARTRRMTPGAAPWGVRLRFPARRVHRRPLRGDDRGHFLLISGLLLVIGFVLFSATMSQVSVLDERTERTQRDEIVRDVDALVAALDRAVHAFVRGGESNVTDFQRIAAAVERAAQDHAARSGLFASVSVPREIPVHVLWEGGRCLGYDPDGSVGGLIMGWDRDTLERGVVAAVFDVHVSDGSRSMRLEYYVEIRPCASDEVHTHLIGWQSEIGYILNPAGSKTLAGTMNLTEEADWSNPVFLVLSPDINGSTFQTQQWDHPANLHVLDGNAARHTMSSGTNFLRFKLDPPPRLKPGDTLEDFTINITAKKSGEIPATRDLYLRIFHPATNTTPAINQAVEPLTDDFQTWQFSFPAGPNGQPGWTYEEIVDSLWVFRQDGSGSPGSGSMFVDHIGMTGGFWTFSAYRLNMRFDWPAIPPVYTDHVLHLHYTVQPGTSGEGFQLEVRDKADPSAPWMLLHELSDTTAEPDETRVFEYPAAPTDPPLPNHPEFRIVDTDHGDNWEPDDEDTLQIHFLRIVSTRG